MRCWRASRRPDQTALTARARRGDPERGLAAGMDDYVSKPIKAALLADAVQRWAGVWSAAYERFCADVDAGVDTGIDEYAAESPAEFFAVLSENSFEVPDVVHREYPALYALLRTYYRQDPLTRLTKASTAPSTAAG